MAKIKVLRKVLERNEDQANLNRRLFREKNVLVINIMGSPGAGKTTFIEAMSNELKSQGIRVGVIEGDYEGSIDAERLSSLDIPVVQLNVNSCHLNANFIKEGVNNLPLSEIDIIFIENVGNLICPSGFDLGEDLRVTLYSVPEGDDKPIKYPVMFKRTDVVVITKTDMLAYFDFDIEKVKNQLSRLNQDLKVYLFSSKSSINKDIVEFFKLRLNQKRES